ncbi:MAG TPA: sigma-70 family RNA polymerase sigma factor [Opitutales bacterium]|nr:sigma-70 family RNA polymerase sigma factor [Opitutales bacterium]
MIPDGQLLRRYAQGGDETAFAELVRRHVDLVYSAALRLTYGDAALAQDVSQSVFTDLARQAWKLTGRATLSGWLHTSVRFAAAKARRGEMRRRTHEQEAFAMQDHDVTTPEIPWEQLRPALDEAVGQLREADRDAVVLRFFQNKSHLEVGAALGVGEEAARKRVDRALEKLREHFARRGVTVSAALLASTIAANSVQAAPAGFAASFSSTALAGAGSATLSAALLKSLYLAMKTKTAVIVVAVLALAAIPAIVEHQQIVHLREDLASAQGKKSAASAAKAAPGQSGANGKAALAQILAMPSRSARLRSLIDLAASLDAKGVRALLDDLIKRPGHDEDGLAASILLERMVQLDPQDALALVKGLKGPNDRKAALQTLFIAWSGLDPAAALTATGQIADAEMRKSLQTDVLSHLANYDPKQALALLQSLPAMQESRAFRNMYEAVFSTWAGNDPAAASAAVMKLPANRMRVFAIQNVADGWASTDPQGALAWAATLPAGAIRSGAMNSALTELAQTDPQAAISFAGNLTDSMDRNNYLGKIASEWGQNDPAAALAWADENVSGKAHDDAVQGILGKLGLSNPEAAQAYVAQMPDNPLRDEAINQLAVSWAEGDPKSALNWMQTLDGPNGATPTVLAQMVNIVNDWAVIDPRGTAAYVQTLEGSPNFGRLMAQIGANWASADPQTALAWAQSVPADGGYNDATKAVLTAIAVQDPQAAWNDAGQMLTGDARNEAMSNIIIKWSAQNPAQAVPALASLPEGSLLDKATSTLATNWLKQDPTAASQWIDTLPAGSARDGAVEQLISAEGANNPSAAFNWALTIGNGNAQQTQLNNVVLQWAQRDPAAAAAAIQSANVSDSQRAYLQGLLNAAQHPTQGK